MLIIESTNPTFIWFINFYLLDLLTSTSGFGIPFISKDEKFEFVRISISNPHSKEKCIILQSLCIVVSTTFVELN